MAKAGFLHYWMQKIGCDSVVPGYGLIISKVEGLGSLGFGVEGLASAGLVRQHEGSLTQQ